MVFILSYCILIGISRCFFRYEIIQWCHRKTSYSLDLRYKKNRNMNIDFFYFKCIKFKSIEKCNRELICCKMQILSRLHKKIWIIADAWNKLHLLFHIRKIHSCLSQLGIHTGIIMQAIIDTISFFCNIDCKSEYLNFCIGLHDFYKRKGKHIL